MKDSANIISILKDFYIISGFRISIYDTEFNEIYSYPKSISPFCLKMQRNSCTKSKCLICDHEAFKFVKINNSHYIYQCARGLYEAVAPIFNYGVLSGYLMMGQVRDETNINQLMIADKTKDVFKDNLEFEKYVSLVKIVKQDKIESYVNIMCIIAQMITQDNKIISKTYDLAEKTKKYITVNYMRNITLDNLSEHFKCCKSTLMSNFKKKYGITVISFLNDVRLNNAKNLISNTDMSYKEISYSCGFYDQNYFSKMFSKKYGISPTVFKQKLNQ